MTRSPIARNTDPNSSHAAAAEITASGTRAAQQQMAAKAVSLHPGCTSLELARKTGLDRYVLARRLPELSGDGLVLRGQERRCTVSGRSAQTWYPPGVPVQLQLGGEP